MDLLGRYRRWRTRRTMRKYKFTEEQIDLYIKIMEE